MARPQTVSDQEILQTARRCFIEGGPSTPLSTIADSLGVSAAAISKRMGPKNDLMLRCLQFTDFDPPPLAWIREGPVAGPLKPQLVKTLRGATAMLSETFPTLVAIRLSGLDMFPDSTRPTPPERFRQALADWIRRAADRDGLAVGSPEVAAGLLVASVQAHAFMNWVKKVRPEQNVPDWEGLITGVLPDLV